MGRFLLLLVLLAAGLGAAWGVCRFTTPCYEARCECEVEFARLAEGGFEEKLNTRLAMWRAELGDALVGVEIARVPRSRLVSLTSRHARAEDAAACANAAAEALAAFTETANVARVEASLATIRAEAEQLQQKEKDVDDEILAVKMKSASDAQPFNQSLLEQEIKQVTADILEQEKRKREASERVEFLERAQMNPENPGDIPASVPESSEVRRAYEDWRSARRDLEKLRKAFKEKYDGVKDAVQREAEAKRHFVDAVRSAQPVAEEVLTSAKNQLKESQSKLESLRSERDGMSLRADQADETIKSLDRKKARASQNVEEVLQKEREIRQAAERDETRVRVVRKASVPAKPLYPNATLVYSVGAGAPVLLWLLFGLLWPSTPRFRYHSHHHHPHHHHSHHHLHHHSHHHSHHHTHQ